MINDEIKGYVFTDAVELSINYWADIIDYSVSNLTAELNMLEEVEGFSKTFVADINTVSKGFDKLFEMIDSSDHSKSKWAFKRLSNFVNENYDAEDCDVVFQLGVFNDVIFG